jgi:YHS domain-containing protein
MIRAFFVEFVFPLLLFLVIRSLLGSFLSRFRHPSAPRPQSVPSVQAGGELKKDPVCGTYVSTTASLTRTVNGQLVHFCSKACSDRYVKER